jgi:UDP-N-acetylmuramoyl-tripeptide--D-alanyl-D-alanine ligase
MKVERRGELLVLNDAYNANPSSMTASLGVLAALPGRRVAVLGDMLELGPGEAAFHAEVIAAAEDLGIDLVVRVGPRMSAARAGGVSFPDAAAAARAVRDLVRPGDRILVKGSRGGKLERVVQALLAEEG